MRSFNSRKNLSYTSGSGLDLPLFIVRGGFHALIAYFTDFHEHLFDGACWRLEPDLTPLPETETDPRHLSGYATDRNYSKLLLIVWHVDNML